jgi:hypothetical protein
MVVLVVKALLIAGFIVVNILFWANYLTHIDMAKEECPDKYANGNFTQFMREFANRSWRRQNKWRYSYFGIGDDYLVNYIHADIIKFGEVGMILDPWSYLRYKIWLGKTAVPKINHSREYKNYWNKV